MAQINAQTIINAVNAAATLAPAYHDAAAIEAMPSGQPHGYDGAAEYGELAAYENNPHGYCYAADQGRKQAWRMVGDMKASAACELRALFNVPLKIKVQTSERGYMRIVNTRERLQAFAATVRSNAKAFGGGMVRTPKAKPAQSWSAGAVRMVRELYEDHDYAGAAELAESKCGALFYVGLATAHKQARAFMAFAPMAVHGLPDSLASARHEDGKYAVIGLAGGQRVKGLHATRKAAEQQAIEVIEQEGQEKLEQAIQKAGTIDHAAARAQWFTEHGIQDAEYLAARIEASEATADTETQGPDLAELQAMAVQDVAQLVATATAAAAIEQAQDAAAPQDVATTQPSEAAQDAQPVRELATVCEASSAANSQAMQQGQANSSAAPAGHGAARTGQSVQSKSGNWSAMLYRNAAGLPSLEFSGPNGYGGTCTFETGCERMQALQAMAKLSDELASIAQKNAITRAPHPHLAQSIEFELRGITWKIEVSRYWKIDAVAEIQRPDLLTWTAYKKGGRYALQHFTRVPGDSVPRDVATRAHAFCLECIAADGAAPIPPTVAPMVSGGAADTPQQPADYTDNRKTLDSEATQLHDTAQDLGNSPSAAATPGDLAITLTRAEGLHDECGIPATVASFADADATLRAWSETVRKGGSSDKVDFFITWPDGGSYEGTYSLRHYSFEAPSLARHLIDFAEFETGLFCPAHMTHKSYDQYLQTVDSERRAYFVGLLETLQGLGVYFAKMRPTALDLRALVKAGATMAQLVGLGVDYAPKQYGSTSGKGAIVEAYPDNWTGVRVEIQLEDGRELDADAADFADDGNYRLNMKNHGAPYLAQLAAAVATVRASASAAKEQAAQAHAAELQRLASEFPQLKQSEGRHGGGKQAAINARILLKEQFKGTKFSVTSDYNSMRISWAGGPTDAAVNAVIGRFDIGASDLQTDYFYTVDTAWSEMFGGAQYVNTYRANTEEETRAALVALFGEDGPSFEDWKAQKMWSQVQHGTRSGLCDEWQWLTMVRQYLNGKTDI